jgi:DNA repair exonuclease SbcCD ATPase subunit/DNA repair exonuclease SbcCD nuclease subunit
MPKLIHLSDTHIPTLKRHDDYREVFTRIYEKLKLEKPDYIVHTGDLFHVKLQLTPESVTLATEFLKSLADIAPVYIIAGNHDTNLRNNKRLDSISPIVGAIEDERIVYLKDSGVHYYKDVIFNVLSIFDRENWVSFKEPPKNDPRPIVALYHGSINGVITDTGYVIEHGDDVIDIFDGHDYALLGDIHLANQIVDPDGRMRYAGSTIQQNFGETNDKGFLIWDIRSKEEFNVEHVRIPNPRPFISIELGLDGEIGDGVAAPKGSRIRLIARNNLSVDKVKNAIDAAKARFKPESVTFVNKALDTKESLQEVSRLSQTLNLRDLSIQEELIASYLKDFKTDNETLEKIYDMNRRFSSQVEQGEEVARNVNWKIKSLEWDNLFNYGEGNKLNFEKLNGVVGIFGKNYTGKSSVIDSLLYTVFNTTSKNNRKNLNIINQNCDKGRGKIVFDVDGNEYVIERTSEKYTKKSKGVETVEAKTDVVFSAQDEELLNGLDRSDTDKGIRRFVGTIDDFLLTSMSSQLNSLAFIGEGSTQRKAILAKFLDLDMFELKFKLAKSEAAEIKAVLKKLEGTDFDAQIAAAKAAIAANEKSISDAKSETALSQEELKRLQEELLEVSSFLRNVKKEQGSLSDVYATMVQHQTISDSCSKRITELDKKLSELDVKEKETSIKLNIDYSALLAKREVLKGKNDQFTQLLSEFNLLKKSVFDLERDSKILDEVPCGDAFPSCKFIKNAFDSKTGLPDSKVRLVQLLNEKNDLEKAIEEYKVVEDNINVYKSNQELLNKLLLLQKDLLLEREKTTAKQNSARDTVEACRERYEELKKQSEQNSELSQKIDREKELKKAVSDLEMKLNSLQQKITGFYKESGYQISTLENLEEQQLELAERRKEFAAYDLYLKAMHPNGISYQVIKNKLPVINSEINKLLANVVDFAVFLVNDDDKLDIMIKHPKYDARPLEMGSGAEKSLASIAIRLAFLNVTSLPKCDVFVLDEPGTALDNDNLAGFIRILELIKGSFKTVLLISHLDVLKDTVDSQIIIDRQGAFAHVNQ